MCVNKIWIGPIQVSVLFLFLVCKYCGKNICKSVIFLPNFYTGVESFSTVMKTTIGCSMDFKMNRCCIVLPGNMKLSL